MDCSRWKAFRASEDGAGKDLFFTFATSADLTIFRIFIIEGVITVGVALFSITFIVKFPDEERTKPSWGFLKPHELDVVINRLNADRGDAGAEKFSWKKFLEPAKVSLPIIL
jgi:hypothetical protein